MDRYYFRRFVVLLIVCAPTLFVTAQASKVWPPNQVINRPDPGGELIAHTWAWMVFSLLAVPAVIGWVLMVVLGYLVLRKHLFSRRVMG